MSEQSLIITKDQILTTNDKNSAEQSQNAGFQPEILNSNLEIRNNTKSKNTNSEKITEVFAASAADVEKQTQFFQTKDIRPQTKDQILTTNDQNVAEQSQFHQEYRIQETE